FPVLGFSVLPAFEHHKHEAVDLGPITNFPQGEFVVSTYLEDPAQGEVTRRTAFIRNNGLVPVAAKQEPSFTIIYSRCAHLGCPVQPGGVLGKEKSFTNAEKHPVTLIPVAGLTGFGCPCHGGQYDTEGNRVAGPPVRSLDRYAFSIRNGHLFLDAPFSVSHVDGTGGTARIQSTRSRTPASTSTDPKPGSIRSSLRTD